MKEIKAIHIFAPGPIAGAEKVVITGLKTLVSLGHETHCLIIQEVNKPEYATTFKTELDKYSVPCTIMTTDKSIDFNLRHNIKSFLKDSTFTHVHTHGYKALFYTFKNSSLKHIHTHHGDTAHTKKVLIYEWIAKQMMKRIDQTVAVSNLMVKNLQADGINKSIITYIPNMLSIHNIEIKPNKKKDKIELISIGRLSEEKGIQDFLIALKDHKEDFKLTILGDGYLREDLEKKVLDMNLSESVTFLGFVKDITQELLISDILILPSHREGLPMTLLEAVCTGKPVLASRVGGIPDIVDHKINGYLFEPKDIIEMKNSLSFTVSNLEEMKKIAKEKAKDFNEQYHPEKWANNTIDLYKKL